VYYKHQSKQPLQFHPKNTASKAEGNPSLIHLKTKVNPATPKLISDKEKLEAKTLHEEQQLGRRRRTDTTYWPSGRSMTRATNTAAKILYTHNEQNRTHDLV
jgi:hypothetical protein